MLEIDGGILLRAPHLCQHMKSYRLLRFGAPLEFEERETPKPRGTEVLLRITATGICHSDLHLCDGGYDLGRGDKLLVGQRGVDLPLTLGHEVSGKIVDAGPEAGEIARGGDWLVYPWIGCGNCAVCRDGNEHLCNRPRCLGIHRDGGYADYMLVPHPRYLLDLEGLDPISAAPYACSGLTAYSALRKTGPLIEREPVVIIGAGGLGLMAVRVLKALGGAGALVVDVDARKREAAFDAGAISFVDGSSLERACTEIAEQAREAPHAVIDFVGSENTARLAFECLGKGGKIVCVGLFGGGAPWPLPLIALKAITIQGNYVGSLGELKELLELVRRKGVPPIPMTRAPLASANEMLQRLRKGEVVGRAVLTP